MARLGSLPRAGRAATRPGGPPRITVRRDLAPWRRRAPGVFAEIMGRPDKPGDDDQ